MKILTPIFALFLLSISSICFAIETDLPDGVQNSQNPDDVSLTPQQSLERITVPDGFKVSLFAGEPDIRRPIAFDFDDRGRLWIVENYSHPEYDPDNRSDRVIILEDSDGDGQFDRRKTFWEGGRYVTAIAFGHGGIWLGNTPELMFIPDRDRDDMPDSEPVVILDGFEVSSNNVLNNFHWGPDGWLYGAIGLNPTSLVGKPGTPKEDRVAISRGMWRMHPITHKFERIADGMVNPWGADFNAVGDLFTVNTVIAHLWHIVPGMYCQRRANEGNSPYVYQRIQSHADHLHWGGGTWQSSRETTETHSVAGGGHAHCGAMIYMGDNWPDKYRDKLFTLNLHGARVNQEMLLPHDSSYVAKHADDLFMANDDWFRGLSIKYGPDGGVYITDWHDFGECHDNDGSHRTSGRIYKMIYGEIKHAPFDLHELVDSQLVELLTHKNEWFVRHARRILQERSLQKSLSIATHEQIRKRFENARLSEVQTLRYLWTLYGMNALSAKQLEELTHHRYDHVRKWAVKLLFDQGEPEGFGDIALEGVVRLGLQGRLVELAYRDTSDAVRLEIASAMQKMSLQNRWILAQTMVRQSSLIEDEMLTLMVWYAIEPLETVDRDRFLQLATNSVSPLLQRFIMRRACEGETPGLEDVIRTILGYAGHRQDMFTGVLEALDGRGLQAEPKSWGSLYRELVKSDDDLLRSQIIRLAGIFGDEGALDSLRGLLGDEFLELDERQQAMRALAGIPGGLTTELLHEMVFGGSELRSEALKQLVRLSNEQTPEMLLEVFGDFDQNQRSDAVTVLVTQRSSALQMLAAIESSEIDKSVVNAFSLEQLRAFSDPDIDKKLESIWPVGSQQDLKAKEISRLRGLLSSEYLSQGDISQGRLLFYKTCFKCHRLFGEGGRVGPDLTGSGRIKVDYLLSNLLDPSAEIDAAYKLTTVITTSGRLYSGFVTHQNDRFLKLQTQNDEVQLQMNQVDEIIPTNKSMMPEGMLLELNDEQIRDLFLYLTGPKQVPLPPAEQR